MSSGLVSTRTRMTLRPAFFASSASSEENTISPEAAPGEAQLLARLSPDDQAAMKWAALHQSMGARAAHGRAVNLDPAALVMDIVLEITAAAS